MSRSIGDDRTGPAVVSVEELMVVVPCGALLVDRDGRISLGNDAALAILRLPREELVGAPIELLLGAPAAVLHKQLCAQHQRDPVVRSTATVRHLIRRHDGSEVLVDITLSRVTISDGLHVLAMVDDASDRARVEARLVLLEAHAEASSDALFSQDAEGRIVTWSRSAERIFGFQEDEILGQSAAVLYPEHLRPEMKLVFDTVAEGERVDRFEHEIQRKDGMPVPISLSMSPVVDSQGQVVGAVSIVQDVTEKRVAQATLAQGEARLRDGEALAHVGRWLWDVGTGAVQWSDELHRIHGVDPLEFAGTFDAYMSYVHPDDQQRVRNGMQSAVASGRRFEDEYRAVRPDGELRWIYTRAEPMVSSADVVVGLRGTGQDVTARRG